MVGYVCGLIVALWTAFGSIFAAPGAGVLPVPTNDSSCLGPTNVTVGAYRSFLQLATSPNGTENGTSHDSFSGDDTGPADSAYPVSPR